MSEYLSRKQFGPVLVTIDSMSLTGVNLRFESVEGEVRVTDNSKESVALCSDVGVFSSAEMFRWLGDEIMRLQTIKNTVDAVEADMRPRVQRMIDDAFAAKAYSLRDMDHMSFQVGYQENKDRDRAERQSNGDTENGGAA